MTDRDYETGKSQAALDAQTRVEDAIAQARAEAGNNPYSYGKEDHVGKILPIGVDIEIDHEGNKIGVKPNPEHVEGLAKKAREGRRGPF